MHILGIGVATLDIVNIVDGYPPEDAEVRALEQWSALGGNAANTLLVLQSLGNICSFTGVFAGDSTAGQIRGALQARGVRLLRCQQLAEGRSPLSCISINQRSGSRTIVHYRELPEFDADNFSTSGLECFDWVHFEGRNIEHTRRMLQHVRAVLPGIPCSVEVEKPRPGIEALFGYANVLLFSRGFARHKGYDRADEFLLSMRAQVPQADLVCAWGEAGAWAIDRQGCAVSASAEAPARIVDTLGAGDVFNAGFIHARMRAANLETALRDACRLAGASCGHYGILPCDQGHISQ